MFTILTFADPFFMRLILLRLYSLLKDIYHYLRTFPSTPAPQKNPSDLLCGVQPAPQRGQNWPWPRRAWGGACGARAASGCPRGPPCRRAPSGCGRSSPTAGAECICGGVAQASDYTPHLSRSDGTLTRHFWPLGFKGAGPQIAREAKNEALLSSGVVTFRGWTPFQRDDVKLTEPI